MSTAAIDERAVPRLGAGVRLQYDKVRDTWGLLAPERLFALDGPSTEVLKLVDGRRCLGAIIDDLAARYNAPRALIADDVTAMLGGLAEKNVLHLSSGLTRH